MPIEFIWDDTDNTVSDVLVIDNPKLVYTQVIIVLRKMFVKCLFLT